MSELFCYISMTYSTLQWNISKCSIKVTTTYSLGVCVKTDKVKGDLSKKCTIAQSVLAPWAWYSSTTALICQE